MQRPDYRAGRQERAVKVYTVCDESRYLVVKNVPSLGCIEELVKLFGIYGDIEEYRLLDEEDCEPFTDIYWIKYAKYYSARFAKRKLDNFIFLGNPLQVSYAPDNETEYDTKIKLEERRRTVLNRIQRNQGTRVISSQVEESASHLKDDLSSFASGNNAYSPVLSDCLPYDSGAAIESRCELPISPPLPMQRIVMEDFQSYEHFSSSSMNATVQLVREKMSKIAGLNLQSLEREDIGELRPAGLESKGKRSISVENQPVISKKRPDNRRRI